MKSTKTSYVKEMNILKGIGILLVVLGHSFPEGPGSENYSFLHQWIYSFHMPLFFLISGFLAKRIYEITNFEDYCRLVSDKFRRLLVPYFMLSFVAIPLKLIMNRYALRPLDLHTLISEIVLYPLNNPIIFFWFIFTLFIIFTLAPLLSKLPQSSLVAILLIGNLIPMSYIRFLNISGVAHYSLYFFAGILLSKNYDGFKKVSNKPLVAIVCFVSLLALNLSGPSSSGFFNQLHNLAKAFMGIICFLNVAYLIKDKGMMDKGLEYLGRFSFDIYLLSWFFQTAARILFYQILEFNYSFVALIMLIAGILGPIVLSQFILRKFDLTNKWLLGNFNKPRPFVQPTRSIPF